MKSKLKASFTLRFFAISTAIFLTTAILGFFASHSLLRGKEFQHGIDHIRRAANILNRLATDKNQKPSDILKFLEREYSEFVPEQLLLIDENAKMLSNEALPLGITPEKIFRETPSTPLEIKIFRSRPPIIATRLSHNEILFRLVEPLPGRDDGPDVTAPTIGITHPQFFGLKPETFFAVVFGVFLVFGYFLFTGVTFYLFQRTGQLAHSVLTDLKSGNLKSRFDENGFFNFGSVGKSFNEMAEEIENLVTTLRGMESQRKDLLQELVHDLKTPVTSLESHLENLRDFSDKMNNQQREEFLNTCLSEVEYFSRLVNDLLFVSELVQTKPSDLAKAVPLSPLLESEIHTYSRDKIKIEKNWPDHFLISVRGEKHLLQRLIRNALDNAVSFARTRVDVEAREDRDFWRIDFLDDGAGFSEEKIKSFGEKSTFRKVSMVKGSRISIGLGAYIMKKIVEAHGGRLEVENRTEGSLRLGARLSLWLPKAP